MQINDLGLYNIVIDFNKMTTYTPNNRIIYKENDINTSKIKAKLIKDDENIDLTDVKVEIRTLTSTQETSVHEVDKVDKKNGIIEYTFPINALCEGINFFELILTKGNMIKISPRIAYEVLDSIEDLSLEKEVNYPILIQLIKDVETLKESTNEFLETAKASESVRIKNEEIRVKQENDRQISIKSMENTFNNKIKEIDDAKNKLVQDVNTKINEVDTSKINMETKVDNKINELDGKFKELQNQDVVSEVKNARGKYSNLNERLDNLDTDLLNVKDTTIIPVITENDFTTVEETVNGYLIDVKLEGKTLLVNSKNEEVLPGTEGATLKSVGDDVDEIVILSRKEDGNICNIETDIVGAYSYGDYKIDSTVGSILIRCEPNTKYYVNAENNDRSVITTYTRKPQRDDKASKVSEDQSIITGANDKYLLYYLSSDVNVHPIKNVYIGKIPFKGDFNHQSNKKKILYCNTDTKTWEKPILRECDSIEEHSDDKYYYHKRSAEEVLNGTENFSGGTDLGNVLRFGLDISSFKAKNVESICDKFIYKVGYSENTEHFYIQDNYLYLFIDKTKLGTPTIEGLKKWLQTNNVTIVYQLAKEEVYECIPIDLIAYEGGTNYIIECGAVIPKSSFKYEGSIKNVINTLKEKISYLEDKLYKTNLANFTVALNALDTKLRLDKLETPK